MFSFADFLYINRLRYLYIITCTVVRPLTRMFQAKCRAATVHFPTAFMTLCEMLVTLGSGAVDHFRSGFSTIATGGNNRWIDLIDIHCNAVVEYVALTFEIFTVDFFAIFNDPSVKLLTIFKPFLWQKSRSFFTFTSARTLGQYFFIFKLLQFFYFLSK